jgi:polygalacturonase
VSVPCAAPLADGPCIADVTLFGAPADGSTLATGSFVAALEACPDGGVVRVPAGTYLLSPFNLTSHTVLDLHPNATLKGLPNASGYPCDVRARDHRTPWDPTLPPHPMGPHPRTPRPTLPPLLV